jgi:NAD-specific glutamate dehydrogenase
VLHVLLHLFVVELPTNQTLEGGDGVLRVDDCLSLSGQAHETLAVLGERDDRGRCPCTFRVLDDAGSLALHDGDARVGRTEVDTDNWTYKIVSIVSEGDDTYAYPRPSSSCS